MRFKGNDILDVTMILQMEQIKWIAQNQYEDSFQIETKKKERQYKFLHFIHKGNKKE